MDYSESAVINFILWQTPRGALESLSEFMSLDQGEAAIRKLLKEKKIVYSELGDQKVIDRGSVGPEN